MGTVTDITPLSPVLPSRTRFRYNPFPKTREDKHPAPNRRPKPDEAQDPDDDKPHIDEYA